MLQKDTFQIYQSHVALFWNKLCRIVGENVDATENIARFSILALGQWFDFIQTSLFIFF